jgi:hypothetical protein
MSKLLIFLAFIQQPAMQPASPTQVKVTAGSSQVGCETKEEFRHYHQSTYEKDGAIPSVAGCHRLPRGSALKELGESDHVDLGFPNYVPLDRYEVIFEGKTLKLWLSPSSVEKTKP